MSDDIDDPYNDFKIIHRGEAGRENQELKDRLATECAENGRLLNEGGMLAEGILKTEGERVGMMAERDAQKVRADAAEEKVRLIREAISDLADCYAATPGPTDVAHDIRSLLDEETYGTAKGDAK